MKKYIHLIQSKTLLASPWLSNALTPTTTTKRWLWLPAGILVAAAGAYLNIVSQSGHGALVDAVIGALIALVLSVLVAIAILLTRLLLQRAERHIGLLPIAAALTAAWLLQHIGDTFAYILAAIMFISAYLVTIALLLLVQKRRRMVASVALLTGGLLSISTALWLSTEPSSESPVAELIPTHATNVARPLLESGSYRVEHGTTNCHCRFYR